MNKFKPGQKVKVVASTYYDHGCSEAEAMIGQVCEIKSSWLSDAREWYRVWETNKSDYWVFNESDLQAVEKTWEGLQPNDILITSNGYERKVLEVLTQTFALSANTNHDYAEGWYTFKEAESNGWKIKNPEPQPTTTELTLQEVADKFGIGVEGLRIKE